MQQFSRRHGAPMCEALEGRTLFSAAPVAASLPSLISAASGGTINLAQGKLTYTRLHGTYSGSYTRGGHTYNFTAKISQFTHTGHFTGTLTVGGVPVIGTVKADFTGRIRTNRHFTINLIRTGFLR